MQASTVGRVGVPSVTERNSGFRSIVGIQGFLVTKTRTGTAWPRCMRSP